jgi:general secretion pathway protein D
MPTISPCPQPAKNKDTGVILSITPRINESGRVLLDIEQEVSSCGIAIFGGYVGSARSA